VSLLAAPYAVDIQGNMCYLRGGKGTSMCVCCIVELDAFFLAKLCFKKEGVYVFHLSSKPVWPTAGPVLLIAVISEKGTCFASTERKSSK
jgi:hypothetical protein